MNTGTQSTMRKSQRKQLSDSSLAIPKNKFIQYLSSVTSIGSAPVNA
jgi:hypothetical protein